MIITIIACLFFIVPLALIAITIYLEVFRQSPPIDDLDINIGSLDIDQQYKDRNNASR